MNLLRTREHASTGVRDTPPVSNRVLVLGGARSGKSTHAESLLADAPAVDYVAPGAAPSADDPEWAARVRLHQHRRPASWRTIETLDVPGVLGADGEAPVLVDCLSTWLSGVMDAERIWDGVGDDALARHIDELVASWAATGRQVIGVSNEVGFGVVPATAAGRRYRDELGRLNARIAAVCDEVWFVVAGIAQRLK